MNLAQRELAARCRGRTLRDVGREAGVSGAFVGKVLNGRKLPGPRLLAYLGLEAYESYRRVRTPPAP